MQDKAWKRYWRHHAVNQSVGLAISLAHFYKGRTPLVINPPRQRGSPLIRGETKPTSISSSALGERRMPLQLFFPQSPAWAPKRYAFAAVCCVVPFALRLLLDPLLQEQAPPLLFTLAVAASAIRGGCGPSIFSTVLGAFGIEYFFPPKGTFIVIAPEYLPAAERQLVVFLVVGVILSWLSGALRHLRWDALGLATHRHEILESITDGFGALDANGRFVYLNGAGAQLMQRPRDQTIGKSLWERFLHCAGVWLKS